MKKTIQPKDQTKELTRVKLEFLKRNPEEWQKLEDLFQKNEKKRGEFLDNLSAISTIFDGKSRDAWDFLLSGRFFDEEFMNKIKEIEIPPAANAVYRFDQFGIDLAAHVMVHGGDDIFHMSEDVRNEKYLDYLCLHAREIFKELTNGEPSNYLLIGIDLRRNKDVILEEVKNLPMLSNLDQIKTITSGIPKRRLKWLSSADELLEVWDLYLEAGKQPSMKTFKKIARRVKRPLSTVRDQWREAYVRIYGKPYDPESKYTTEEKRGNADQLCAQCPHGAACYKRNGEWIPCRDYLNIAGKEKNIKTTEYRDEFLYDDSILGENPD